MMRKNSERMNGNKRLWKPKDVLKRHDLKRLRFFLSFIIVFLSSFFSSGMAFAGTCTNFLEKGEYLHMSKLDPSSPIDWSNPVIAAGRSTWDVFTYQVTFAACVGDTCLAKGTFIDHPCKDTMTVETHGDSFTFDRVNCTSMMRGQGKCSKREMTGTMKYLKHEDPEVMKHIYNVRIR